MTRNSCIKKNSDNIVTNEIDGELVMVNIDMGKYYGFDNIGTKVWELIEEETKIADIIKTEKYYSKYPLYLAFSKKEKNIEIAKKFSKTLKKIKQRM